MAENYILALDQGTTSSRAIVFDRGGNIVSSSQREFEQIYPNAGWVEHDPGEIWSSQSKVAKEAVSELDQGWDQVAAIGITNQRETTLLWDRESGKPIYNAIVWQDRRTSDYCDELKERKGLIEKIQKKTGLIIDAYFSATKIRWILDNVDSAREKAERGELAFGTVDSWLVWNLTGGISHITDSTNASRTMLYNIHEGKWDGELLELFEIPDTLLPEVKSSSEIYDVERDTGADIPISGIAGDQQAALFGQRCISPGMVKNTYGTGCFMMINTGDEPIISDNNLLSTIGWEIDDTVEYALEGSIFIAGAVVQWLRDELGIIQDSSDVEKLAASVEDNGGAYFVPAFAGLGAPHWNQHVRGTMVGLTRGTGKGHIARAALESIAYQTMDVITAMQADAETEIKELRVDGGATDNNMLMQFQSDLLQVPVVRPNTMETTALGAAYLAGLAVNFWDSQEEINDQWEIDATFTPQMSANKVERLRSGWNRALEAAIQWSLK